MSESSQITYCYLHTSNLNKRQIKTTLRTYTQRALTYSELEWKSDNLQAIFQNIFSEQMYQRIVTGTQILFAGCGTLRDVLVAALLNQRLLINGLDLTPEMLKVGFSKIVYRDLGPLVTSMAMINPQFDASAVLLRLDAIDAVQKIRARIFLSQGNVNMPPFPPKSFDLILAVAMLQHLSKKNIQQSISRLIDCLKPGGGLYFDFRIDPNTVNSELRRGRVFRDNVLGANRYYNTFSRQEVDRLLRHLEAQHKNLLISIDPKLHNHIDSNKPPFLNVFVERRYAPG